MINKKIISLMVSAAFLIGSTSVFANEVETSPKIEKVKQFEKKQEIPEKRDFFASGIFEGVDLTDVQKVEIKKYMGERFANKENSLSPRENMKLIGQMNKELKSLTFSDDYSKEKVSEVVSKYAKLFENKVVFQSDIDHKIYIVLNDTQKEQYKKNIAKFEERMSEFGKGGFKDRKGKDKNFSHERTPHDNVKDHVQNVEK